MINTRLIYKEISSYTEAMNQLLKIQGIIQESLYMKRVNDSYYIYSHQNCLMVGHEVTGREEDFYHHPEIKILDFHAKDFMQIEISFQTYQELNEKIENQMSLIKMPSYRIEFNPQLFNLAPVTFFVTEKSK